MDTFVVAQLAQINKTIPNWDDGIDEYFIQGIKIGRCSPVDKSKDYVYWGQKHPGTAQTQVAYFGFDVKELITEYQILKLADKNGGANLKSKVS